MEKNPNLVKSFEEVVEHWKNDATIISLDHPDKDASILSNLHAKYITIRSNHNLMVKKYTADLKMERKFRWRLYMGKVTDKAELDEHNATQFDEKILRTDVPIYLDADPALNKLQLKIDYHQEVVTYCDSVLKAISGRSWDIKNVIAWATLEAGG